MMRIYRTLLPVCMLLAASLFCIGSVSGAEGSPAAPPKKGTITGVIKIKNGEPLSGGQVVFFNVSSGPPPQPEMYDRTPDYVRNIDENGRFTVDLPAGDYYLGASRKASGEPIGPPKKGDYVWRSLDEQGKPKAYHIRAGERLDIGTVEEAIPLESEIVLRRAVTTAIEGVVMDMEGRPVPDAVVVAFTERTVRGKPKFISEKTDKEGKYVLRIAEGTYYLRVRNEFASGPPEPGQIVGYYGDEMPDTLTIKKGEVLKGVDFKVILFPGRGPFSGTR